MIFRIALRYAFSKEKGQRASSIWISIGIAVGLIALIIISSTVNALQSFQLSKIRSVESFDITVRNIEENEISLLSHIENVDSVYKYSECYILVQNPETQETCSARLRGVDNSLFKDKKFSDNLILSNGNSIKDGQISISPYLFNSFIRLKDGLKITFLKKGRVSSITPLVVDYKDVLTFSCNLSDFSRSTVLLNLNEFLSYVPNASVYAGIYVKGGNIEKTCSEIKQKFPQADVISYKKYSSSLYSALLLEKTIIYVFIGFVFLIICTNLKGSTARLINLKRKETAILRAIGMTKASSNAVFLLQGFIISFTGVLSGSLIGYLLARNIRVVLNIVDKLVYLFSGYHSVFSMGTFNAGISYSQVLLFGICIIFLSCLFTWMGIKKSKKSEVIEDVSGRT